jgi:Ser/Thr protein kinase RdoA (MazF antagonist)
MFVREFALDAVRLCRSSSLSRATKWVNQALSEAALGVVIGFEPFRISSTESVVAFQTSRGESAYLKCSNRAPFTEALVTQVLADKWPIAVPETIGFYAKNGWWLTKEVRGDTLEQALTLEQCVGAIDRFARMQKDLRKEQAAFANCGMCSTRLTDIDVDATLSALARAGGITPQELDEMRSSLKRAFARLVELDFPESIIHRDLTPWNIKLAGDGPCFLDWEDATWGPAIVSLEIFLATLRTERRNLRGSGWFARIREAYFRVWEVDERMWIEPVAVRASRGLALFCQVRDFVRLAETDRRNRHLRVNAVQSARKLNRIISDSF